MRTRKVRRQDGPDVLRFPASSPTPVTWFARWHFHGDEAAKQSLAALGILVSKTQSSPARGGSDAR